MLVLSILSFSLCYLFPGNPLINLTGQVNASPEKLAELGLLYKKDEVLFYQYMAYISQIFQGNLGVSMSTQHPIYADIFNLLPATIELSINALIVSMCIGIPIGFISAINHRKTIDNVILSFSMVGYSIPVFWLGLLAILIFSIELGWFPSAGRISLLFEIEHITGILFIDILLSDSPYKWQAFMDASAHLILPVFVVALAPMTIFIRLARTSMIEVLDKSYIKAAKAKGLSFTQIIFRHGIRNALVNIIRHVGLQFANLITFSMVTEVIFSWPGIGRWLIESIYHRDYTAIQGGLLVLSGFIFIVHIITDFIYATLNPLSRESKHGSR